MDVVTFNGGEQPSVNGISTPDGVNTQPALRDAPAWTPLRKLKVVTVGAGFSGLIFAHKLQHQHPEFQAIVDHQILEAGADIGGTWLVNRYPGVQCDVPAHIYV
jgi:hypothetical protein